MNKNLVILFLFVNCFGKFLDDDKGIIKVVVNAEEEVMDQKCGHSKE